MWMKRKTRKGGRREKEIKKTKEGRKMSPVPFPLFSPSCSNV